MLLRQLEYLVAPARERHFGRAAAACHVSQPSLSAAIRTLEKELDTPLVHRFDGLTPEGERVLLWAHRILAERDALVDDLAAMRQGLTGTLRIAAIPTALTAASLLTAPFCARRPHARVSPQSLSSREIAHGLAEFELDVALTYLDGDGSAGPGVRAGEGVDRRGPAGRRASGAAGVPGEPGGTRSSSRPTRTAGTRSSSANWSTRTS